MKITEISLTNVRGFKVLGWTKLSSKINVFIGANNSGKSTILNSILLLQKENSLTNKDITLGETNGEINLAYSGSHPIYRQHQNKPIININLSNNQRQLIIGNSRGSRNLIASVEPHNLIYPYLSKRKTTSYSNEINENNTKSVNGDLFFLNAKIDRLANPQYQPGNAEYVQACNDILGFEISTLVIGSGKEAVYYIHKDEHIPLKAMGEGVSNILGLVTDLCIVEDKVFVIEEPENDIHPKSLKALLNLIIKKSDSNQFFISTHSNIVMKHLGAIDDTKIFRIANEESDENLPKLKKSTMEEISDDPIERKKVLEELGYDFFDHDLWKAWLFLEESSAEIIIRDHLIRWFTPKLVYQLRTFSANSISQVIPKFDDFNRLFVFLHLEPTYKNRVWVYIDDGENEKMIIEKMKEKYTDSGWDEGQFNQFSEHDFERYFPARFQNEISEILAMGNKQKKRKAKNVLLDDVKKWISENDKEAKAEFKESAKEIITVLKSIEKSLNNSN